MIMNELAQKQGLTAPPCDIFMPFQGESIPLQWERRHRDLSSGKCVCGRVYNICTCRLVRTEEGFEHSCHPFADVQTRVRASVQKTKTLIESLWFMELVLHVWRDTVAVQNQTTD